jgi:hypothetical protein
MIGAAAYTNNFAGATSTTLFVIDHNTDKLYQQNPPNNGTLVETGSLGINITNANGFDIGSMSQKAFACNSRNSTKFTALILQREQQHQFLIFRMQ